MATTNHVQVHICVGIYHGREDWEMLKMIKRMRVCRGIQSVRVLLTSNWIASDEGIVYQGRLPQVSTWAGSKQYASVQIPLPMLSKRYQRAIC